MTVEVVTDRHTQMTTVTLAHVLRVNDLVIHSSISQRLFVDYSLSFLLFFLLSIIGQLIICDALM